MIYRNILIHPENKSNISQFTNGEYSRMPMQALYHCDLAITYDEKLTPTIIKDRAGVEPVPRDITWLELEKILKAAVGK